MKWVLQLGGIGFLHYNMGIEEQVKDVRQVKEHQRQELQQGCTSSLDNNGRCFSAMHMLYATAACLLCAFYTLHTLYMMSGL